MEAGITNDNCDGKIEPPCKIRHGNQEEMGEARESVKENRRRTSKKSQTPPQQQQEQIKVKEEDVVNIQEIILPQ